MFNFKKIKLDKYLLKYRKVVRTLSAPHEMETDRGEEITSFQSVILSREGTQTKSLEMLTHFGFFGFIRL